MNLASFISFYLLFNPSVKTVSKVSNTILDGIKIIDKKATIQELIIRYLINSYIENIYITTSKYVSIHQIVKFLQMNGVKSDDYETQIRKAIWRIRSICYRVSQIELIESEAWKGYRIKSSIFIGKL